MRCELCWKITRCSCKWGGCPQCGSTNKQIAIMNDLIKFWLSKDTIKKEMKDIRTYVDKIDTFTLYEYYSKQITEEEFNKALEEFRPNKKQKTIVKKPSEVVDTTWRVNPENQCVFSGPWAWQRCIYCNGIRKYMQWKECPKHKNPVDTVIENE